MVRNVARSKETALRRGTTGYAINAFRSDILVQLQIDLKFHEKTGIDESVCAKIKILLSALTSAASAEPKASLWGPAIHTILRDYEDVYRDWNDVKGTDPNYASQRSKLLEDLQDIRQKLARACRKNSHSLSQAHDLALIDAINSALIETIKVMPGTFSALTKGAERFNSRAVSKPEKP